MLLLLRSSNFIHQLRSFQVRYLFSSRYHLVATVSCFNRTDLAARLDYFPVLPTLAFPHFMNEMIIRSIIDTDLNRGESIRQGNSFKIPFCFSQCISGLVLPNYEINRINEIDFIISTLIFYNMVGWDDFGFPSQMK